MDLEKLIKNPQESLAVELKAWIDPNTIEAREKIVKGCIAMRNNNGGYILIGFDDKNRQPTLCPFQEQLREKFNVDIIQGLVSKYSSEQFEIKVNYLTTKGFDIVVIEIPPGVKTPTVTKSSLENVHRKVLLKANTVYIRSLSANNTPSTTEIQLKDWQNLIEKCFDNREADIGRFLKRHFTESNLKNLGLFLEQPHSTRENLDEMKEFIKSCEEKYNIALKSKKPNQSYGIQEVGAIIKGNTSTTYNANKTFLNLINVANPLYTGWEPWRLNQESEPKVKSGAWESLVLSTHFTNLPEVVFWRIDPSGKFFLLNTLQDDVSLNAPEPLSALDFVFPIIRTGEAILAAISFAKTMRYDLESTIIKFGFKWTKLKDRKLCSWVRPSKYYISGGISNEDEFYTETEIAMNAHNNHICSKLHEIINGLFSSFDGCEIRHSQVEYCFDQLINRTLAS